MSKELANVLTKSFIFWKLVVPNEPEASSKKWMSASLFPQSAGHDVEKKKKENIKRRLARGEKDEEKSEMKMKIKKVERENIDCSCTFLLTRDMP